MDYKLITKHSSQHMVYGRDYQNYKLFVTIIITVSVDAQTY